MLIDYLCSVLDARSKSSCKLTRKKISNYFSCFKGTDFWCTEKSSLFSVYFDRDRQVQFFPNSCPTVPCQNEGVCQIDIDNINSRCV